MVQLSDRQFINVIWGGRGGNLDTGVTVMKSIKIYFFCHGFFVLFIVMFVCQADDHQFSHYRF